MLPDAVLKLLGEDATPKEVRASEETSARTEAKICEHGRWVSDVEKHRKALAWRAWAALLKAAAIALAEADANHNAIIACETEFGLASGADTKAARQTLVDARRKYSEIRDLPRREP